ncbi:type II secretion system minor pseudopilin GspJ [Colwellia sp. MSW7]|jgi:general secretion pathway protein J|uniref:Type II secretion system protein J n=1 Tax=Colwellia maritima TaxID=2912588 RepID=A0ABS9WXH4_9GAMM|nr:type II secretion system minor pseudopilin GspJ [Colwellia maritima]MCI2282664.1 type II secretion system minor pseudopilin GspJ [Colwellia maritima]
MAYTGVALSRCFTHKHENKGFTLLEVLIAIAIFSLISLSSFTIFDSVLKGDATSKERSERQNELQRAFLIIERDITQIARRTIRFEGEAPSAQFIQSTSDTFGSEDQAVAFVRQGWTNPGLLLPRSDMQAVSYRLFEGTLQRLHANFVDSVVGEEPKIRPLISDVTAVSFEYYDGDKWQKSWSNNTLPLAMAIEVDTKDYGVIRRQFLVPGDGQSKQTQLSGSN